MRLLYWLADSVSFSLLKRWVLIGFMLVLLGASSFSSFG